MPGRPGRRLGKIFSLKPLCWRLEVASGRAIDGDKEGAGGCSRGCSGEEGICHSMEGLFKEQISPQISSGSKSRSALRRLLGSCAWLCPGAGGML